MAGYLGAGTLTLVRHGEVEERYRGCYVGGLDARLSPKGREEAARLKPLFDDREGLSVWCSPKIRCRETAAIALGAGTGGVRVEEDLREMSFGAWEGRGYAQIAAETPDLAAEWERTFPDFRFPGGDKVSDFIARVRTVMEKVLSEGARRTVLFTHGGVIRVALCLLLGTPFERCLAFDIGYASVTRLRFRRGGFRAEKIGEKP